MRILTWNCRRATARSDLWTHLLALSPDIAILQEVCGVSSEIRSGFAMESFTPVTKGGHPQRFSNIVLAKGKILGTHSLKSKVPWIQELLEHFAGNLATTTIELSGREPIEIVSVYSPAWPVERASWAGRDVEGVKLTQNPDIWVSDLLHAVLKELAPAQSDRLVVAGDFNLCESFDWKQRPRGNREYLDRLAQLGLVDALRQSQGALTPTFKGPRHSTVANQLDYLFVSHALQRELQCCVVGDESIVINRLSDHLPVIADFDT